MPATSINPATGEVIARYDNFTPETVNERLERADRAFRRHRLTSFDERTSRINRVAELLEERASRYGELITREMGKPIRQAEGEVRKCAKACRYYAGEAEAMLRPEEVPTEIRRSYVAFQPLGPILAVMPWNFPFWQVFRFAAPALMAGNVGLLKHASNVTGCALAIEEVIRDGGFETDEFQSLIIASGDVAGVIADPRIRAATLTGSEGAGRSVGAEAGKHIKPSVLELGGSDPFIVLADADLDEAVEIGVRARMQNNGQSCIAAKRFIVEEPVWAEYTERYVERVRAMKIGDPMDDTTELGPLVRAESVDEIDDQVRRSLDQGARLLCGGKRIDRPGFFYEPTVLTDVLPGMVAFEEEVFGPVASMIRARDVDHAVELSNQSPLGLGGAVFTQDVRKGEDVALRLEVGSAFVNAMVQSDPRLPFGGLKNSGYGRELSHYGLREFVNVKTVWIQ